MTIAFCDEFESAARRRYYRKRLVPCGIVLFFVLLFAAVFLLLPKHRKNEFVLKSTIQQGATATLAKILNTAQITDVTATTTVTTTATKAATTTTVVTTVPTTTTTAQTVATTTITKISLKAEYENGIALKVGESTNICKYLDNYFGEKITCIADSDSVLSISENGNITAFSVGEATLAVLDDGDIVCVVNFFVTE